MRIREAADYLLVAPKVVAVARDLALPHDGLELPRAPADPDALADLAARWRLDSPLERLTKLLAGS